MRTLLRFGVLGLLVAMAAAWIPVALLPGVALADPADEQSLTVVLDMQPNDAANVFFDFQSFGSFTLDDDAGATGEDVTHATSKVIDVTDPGNYSLLGVAPGPPWALVSLTCDDPDGGTLTDRGHHRAEVDIDPAEDVTCTYTYTRQSLTVVLDMQPNVATDVFFDFETLGFFTLDDDAGATGADATYATSRTIDVADPGNYSLVGIDPGAPWALVSLTCDDPDGGTLTDRGHLRAEVDVDPAEHITCTYTYTRQSLTVVLDMQPNDATDVFFDFEGFFTLDDDDGATGEDATNASSTAIDITDPGNYELGGFDPGPPWTLASLTCDDPDGGTLIDRAHLRATVDVDPAEHVTCTYTYTVGATADTDEDGVFDEDDNCPTDPNADQNPAACAAPVTTQTITIVLDNQPDSENGATFGGEIFAGLEDDGDELDAQPSSITFTHFLPDQVTVSEDGVPIGYVLTAIACNDAGTIVTETTLSAEIDLDPGEHITCTFVNSDQTLTIVLDNQPDSENGATFGGAISASLEDDGDELDAQPSSISFTHFLPDQLTISEDGVPIGYFLTAIVCDDAGTIVTETTLSVEIDLDPGEHITCTFVNSDQTITIVLDNQPDSENGATFGGAIFAGLEDDGDELDAQPSSATFTHFLPDQVTVSEDGVPIGYVLTAINCDDAGTIVNVATLSAVIDLDPGEHVTCTFVNSKTDLDDDGVPNEADACPLDPEDMDGVLDADGCPETDADNDGVLDTADACDLSPEDLDGVLDADGCPETDADGDGVLDAADSCPLTAEDLDGIVDADGCPETDADGDGVLDAADVCPLTPEDLDGNADADGCPEVDPVAAIAFTSSRTGFGDVYVMAPDGTGQTRLTNNVAIDGEPAWSPDRTKIAFSSSRTGKGDIYVMNADGTGVTRLTNSSGIDVSPAWSPDGTKIAFASSRTGDGDIYVMNADGTGQTRLTTHGSVDAEPAWSQDGTNLAFTSARTGSGDIYTMKSDGTNQTRRTTNSAIDASPAWSPDGTKIAFSSTRTGFGDIYVMNPDGTSQTRVTNHSAIDGEPAWSPDGTKIAFGSSRTGFGDIYVMNADGSVPTRLTNSPGIDLSPAWR